MGESAAAPSASAALRGADGTAHGTARIEQTTSGLTVTLSAIAVPPGIHAVHVHTTGTCTAPDFASAGGHWNPMGRQHGMDNPNGSHMGDMPNMTVGADGTGTLVYTIAGGTLTDGANPLFDADGAAIVIHAKADDNVSDPAGNAGGRIACGVLAKG
ncbi:superoxide dismutase family protein [Sphingobium algorifonticola]|uniref:Superoxide dismutase family protein n=2 Tax=Sphingobium algorifonticola TaxID=2008318 RepID=A0A437JEE8_9SPHN|nr:superoxide dismutase family protein [Sphingobium algorifonticola]RVT43982.1 superoxide dismutase family protein [Sphingobium algorifonticola]